ncbi:UBN2 domain-containing protein [Tanacetum coccineum]
MASTRALTSKRLKINIIPPKRLFVDLTQDDTTTPSPQYLVYSPSLNSSILPPPRLPAPPLSQENESMEITLTLLPITPLDIQFNTPSPLPPLFGHPIPWNLLEAHVVVVVLGVVLVVGPNGAGKGTLLKLMTWELTPLKGMVRHHNHLRIAQYHQHLAKKLDLENQTISRWNCNIMGFKEHLRTKSGP